MLALLKLVPFRDWLYCAVIALLLIGGFLEYKHIQHEAANAAIAAIKASDAAAAAAAEKQKAADTADYQANLSHITESYNAQIQQANAAGDDLARRLRVYTASHSCPVLPSAAPATPAGTAAPDSVGSAIEGLIRAAEHDLAVINAERLERDALTGK
jgi:hypothetical protein